MAPIINDGRGHFCFRHHKQLNHIKQITQVRHYKRIRWFAHFRLSIFMISFTFSTHPVSIIHPRHDRRITNGIQTKTDR